MRIAHGSLALALVVMILVSTIIPSGLAADPPPAQRSFGLIPSEGDFPKLDTSCRPNASFMALPRMVDLSAGLPPVGDQGRQNSCVGWALGYYYKTLQEHQEHGWDVSLPQHQFSPAWIYNQRSTSDCSRDIGMSFYDGLLILQEKGAASLAMLPYAPNDPCAQPSQAVRDAAWPYRAQSFANIYAGRGTADLEALKGILADGQPFAIAVPVYASFFEVSRRNPLIRQHSPGEAFYGGHAMIVVGYDDTIGGFKTVNSWGAWWGLNGYAYLSYDFVQNDTWEAWVMTDYVQQAAPSTFWGAISLNGQSVSPDTEVVAWISDTRVATSTVQFQNGTSVYTLTVPADDPTTVQREGGRANDGVRFKIGTVWASENGSWSLSNTQKLDLHAPVSRAPRAYCVIHAPLLLTK